MSLALEHASVLRRGQAILRDASLALNAGELLVVVGPNGAGKSTLLSLLAGDAEPTDGQVLIDGRSLNEQSLETLALRRAVVGSPPRLAFDYTVRDVIAMGWMHRDRFGSAVFEMALATHLDMCELNHLAERTYMTLSSGERQRVEYARACLQLWRPATEGGPRYLLLDEPTSNLDVAHGISLLESLRDRVRAGDGVLAVLHDLDLAARFADRVALMSAGRVACVGPTQDVLTGERLSAVYRTPIHVEHHASLQRLVVIG